MVKLESKAGLLSTCMRARLGQSDWRRKQTTTNYHHQQTTLINIKPKQACVAPEKSHIMHENFLHFNQT